MKYSFFLICFVLACISCKDQRKQQALDIDLHLREIFFAELGYTLMGVKPISFTDCYSVEYNPQVKRRIFEFLKTAFHNSPKFILKIYNKKYRNHRIILIHKNSLQNLISKEPILANFVKEKYGNKVYFKVMGDPDYINEELGITGILWSSNTEVKILESFDIGIMPLPNDDWVKGKCGLKGLSYMSLEVPTIMSAVGVNTEIITDGINGYLADSDEEWIEKLSRLIDSYELRRKFGLAGRKTVEEKYSFEAQKNNYLDSFNELLKR